MDAFTLSIAVGLIVSLLFTEVFGLSTGGMIVPGYLALYLNQPVAILGTLAAAAVTYAAVRALSRFAIIYGRRRIVMMVLFGFLVGSLLRCALVPAAHQLVVASPENLNGCCVVGFIIPGLIALWMDRQGCIQTLAPLLTSSVMVRLVLVLIGMEVLP